MSITTNMLCIYLKNAYKNYALVGNLLETQKDLYDILFIQKYFQNFICFAPSITTPGGDGVVNVPIHPNWTQVV